jgi:endo-1,4-beta-xylanase
MKWERIHPEPGVYDFEIADSIVAFGERHGMEIVGHTLVWHSQTPRWVFEDGQSNPVGRDTLLARMRDHIQTVVGRYRGRVVGWDVVNEALNDDGTLRDSPWRRIIGDDYIAKAFEFTYEADPDAGLYYNDYSLPNEPRRIGAVALIRRLQEDGVPITGIGMQGHYQLDWPSVGQLDSSIVAFSALGIEVMITELDMNVLPAFQWGAEISDTAAWRAELDPYTEGLPDSVQQVQAEHYAELFGVFLNRSDAITRVTFWGVTDASSWKNNWPIPGRTNYPLLFDRMGQPKPAFDAVIEVSERKR